MRFWFAWTAGACGIVAFAAGCRAPAARTTVDANAIQPAPEVAAARVSLSGHLGPDGARSEAIQSGVDAPASEIRQTSSTTVADSVARTDPLQRIEGVPPSRFAQAVAAATHGGMTHRDRRPRAAIAEAAFQTPDLLPESEVAAALQSDDAARTRFEIPPDIPGAEVPRIELPYDPQLTPEVRQAQIRSLYGDLLPLPPEQTHEGPPLALRDVERLAFDYNPKIRERWAAVQSARGAAIQAGLYPNPEAGYQSDTVNTGATAGYHGAYLAQTFVTAGKLGLARQTAQMKVRAAEYEYLKTRYEVVGDVRRAYFRVLIAEERLRLARAMSMMSEETYQAQIELVVGGQSAADEPMQLRVLALAARNELTRAENAYQAAWRELNAAIGQMTLTSSNLTGSVEVPSATVSYEEARATIVSRHTDLSVAQARIAGANCNLQLQRNVPIPNIKVNGVVQYDDTSSRNDMTYNLQLGVPLPLFDRNQGNIASAQADLAASQNSLNSARNDLMASLAENYGRYSSGRQLALVYRTEILPSQVQAYRGIYERFRAAGGDVDMAQVVLAQQTLGQAVRDYLDVLGEAWLAIADLSELLQVDDPYTMDGLARIAVDAVPPQAPAADE